MQQTARRLLPRLLSPAVLALLVVVAVIQFQWFSRSASVEIDGTVRALESAVRQTVLREFQRYAPMVAELERLHQAGPAGGSPQDSLSALLKAYGPGGTAPGLVSWVGWAEAGQGVYHRAAAPAVWTTAAFPDEGWAAEARGLEPGGAPPRDNVLVVRGVSPRDPVLLVGLDVRRFFETYVFDALKETYPGAGLAWSESLEEGPPPGGFDRHSYSFNPFSALFGASSLAAPLNVGVPRFIDLGHGEVRGPGVPNFRVFASWVIAITLPPENQVLGIEGRLAWNWLGTNLLLLSLGAAFLVVRRQSARLADLRRREREFVASVSHELRTPLTVIRSAADNFQRGIVAPDRQVTYGRLIHDQAVRLGRMIEQMLAFAQTEAGAPQKVLAPIVFETWLAELRPALDTLAASRNVGLHWDVSGVPTGGRTDPEVLRLILENLVVNAVNHAYPAPRDGEPLRPVRVTLRYLVPGRLELTVDDDGRGIAAKESRKVFEPFYRDLVSRNNQEKGSGLGLFLAHRQARRLGGDLKLETPWRRADGVRRPGCRFTAVIPLMTEASDGR